MISSPETLFEVGLERSINLGVGMLRPSTLRAESVEVLDYMSEVPSMATHPSARAVGPATCLVTTDTGGGLEGDRPGGPDEIESLNRFSHRFSWLVALLVLQSLSSFILKRFQGLLVQHPIIVFFLTMLVGAGGNAGSQSTVLVIRAIARNDFYPHKTLQHFVRRELWTGLKLATILSAVSFARVYLFEGTVWEVAAICVSMYLIVFVAVLIGTFMPLALWWCGFDPAHAGAAIQVTIDIMGVSITCLVSVILLAIIPNWNAPRYSPILIRE